MKIVIDVPEDEYQICLSHRESIESMIRVHKCFSLEYAVVRGTPLPKGHGRLIDADAVLVEPFGDTYKDIDIAETIIEADRSERSGEE